MTQLWNHRLGAPAGGLAFARETGHSLAWDSRPWLVLLNRRGELQGQIHLEAPLVAGAIAEDASAFAIADDRGQVSWLAPDLTPRWHSRLAQRPTALAIDPLGRGLAVADAGNQLHFFDSGGRSSRAPIESARAFVHLAFSTSAAVVMAAAEFGFVGALDGHGRWLWQDVPVVHLGSIACSGDGQMLAVGCFSEGVRRYDAGGRQHSVLPTPDPCRLVVLTFDGRRAVVAGVFGALHALDMSGKVLWSHPADQPVVGIGLSPLGDRMVVALADGVIVGLDLGKALR